MAELLKSRYTVLRRKQLMDFLNRKNVVLNRVLLAAESKKQWGSG